MKEFKLEKPFIKLDQFLKATDQVCSGGEAKIRIIEGEVLLNDEICTQRGKKLYKNDIVCLDNICIKIID